MLRNGTRVQKGGFAEEGVGLRNYFAADGHFPKGLFWAAKFRRPLKFLGFELLFAPWNLPSFSLQFLLQKIIQKEEVTYN